MSSTRIRIGLSRVCFVRDDWTADFDREAIVAAVDSLRPEYASLGISFELVDEDRTVRVASYSDLLNAVRLSSSKAGLGSPCLGHIIGASAHCDIVEDLKKGIGRLAFAPETIAPDSEFRKVCHNCGCGC
ncbi:MAG: hypothetical protein D6794_06595 [Deltaproteobacteria bacterium]|nr:MAG: hypothetical protein D6794_06595 [Deltaproteobacteria bacterium]